jgi:DNA-directed RNA polymerase subunit M/transcription elongation factor TFIIS
MLDNLEKAKNSPGDGAEAVPEVDNQSYEDKANYKLTCTECGQEIYRIQLKGRVRDDAESDRNYVQCAECGGKFEHEEI